MKKTRLGIIVLALLASAQAASASLSAVLSTGHGTPFGNPIYGTGGYFTATLSGSASYSFGYPGGLTTVVNANGTTSYRTFCVEDVYFIPGTSYTATIDDQVLQGGPSKTKDLNSLTRNLYANYVENIGTMGFGTIGEDGSKNRAMQALFWDYQAVFGGAAFDGYSVGAKVAFGTLSSYERGLYDSLNAANLASANTDAANVKALNIWSGVAYSSTSDAQSQLILTTPLGLTPVPTPAASVLLMIGLALIGSVRRSLS